MRNVAAGTTRYEIDPADHIALRRALRGFEPALLILGVYHSHPAGDAVPSASDLREAAYPDWMYMIVGLGRARAVIRAFRIRAGRAQECEIRWR